VAERDDARRSLAAAISERDALLRERDSARAARQRDLEALDELADRGPSPSAPRPVPRQSALALWGQRLMAVVALGVFAFVLYTLLEGVV
jgi:Ser/Thr protein kinase RdoA (MazF antagonist)